MRFAASPFSARPAMKRGNVLSSRDSFIRFHRIMQHVLKLPFLLVAYTCIKSINRGWHILAENDHVPVKLTTPHTNIDILSICRVIMRSLILLILLIAPPGANIDLLETVISQHLLIYLCTHLDLCLVIFFSVLPTLQYLQNARPRQ